MKICYFADGESIHTVRWCKYFEAIGYEVHLISFKNVFIDKVTTHYVKSSSIRVEGGNWKLLFGFREVKKILNKIKPDIFHSLYATSYGITGAFCRYHPFIITALGTDVLISPHQSFLYKLFLKYAFSKSDWITVMSDQMKRVIEEMGVPSLKISIITFGIDPKIFNNTSRKLSSNKFVISSTRNFEKIYNVEHLILAIAQAIKIIPHIHLNLIGSGSLQKQIEKLVYEKGLSESVTFFGKITQTEIAEVLNQSHLFVSVSLSDGNNISLNEGMACGTFCIVTDIPANNQPSA